jgi:uncharacterized protein YdaU (DUF1376 family)
MHYYSHHIGDFQRDTASLSDTDTLAYLRLIWMYYDTEQPLPNDSKKLAFRIGSDPDAVQMLLEAFFVFENGVWNQKRCDAEIASYRAKSDRARNANGVRWQSKRDLKSDPDKIATNNQEPITNNQEIKPPIPPKGGGQAISFVTYLENCKQEGCKPIPENNIVFDYAKKVGLPNDFLKLQWLEFKTRYSLPNAKRYRRWDTVFYKSVQGNWFKLWFADKDEYVLTTVGQQAKKANREAA